MRRPVPTVALVLLFALAVAGCGDSTPPTMPVTNAAKQKESMRNEDGTPMKR